SFLFLFTALSTTEIYTLSLHDALPISAVRFISSVKTFKCKVCMSTFFPSKTFWTIKHVCFNLRCFLDYLIYFGPIYLHHTFSLFKDLITFTIEQVIMIIN